MQITTAANVSISGRVTVGGRGLINAVVTVIGTDGTAQTARTGSFGYYRFDEIAAGQTVIIRISSKRFQFAPQFITVNEDVENLNFTAQTDQTDLLEK